MKTNIDNLMTLAQEFACAWAYFGGPLDDGDGQEQADEAKEALRAALVAAFTGLPVEQEPKYTVSGSAIVNRASGEAIPADEPVFILRGRDKKAITALATYGAAVVHGQMEHWDAVQERINDFRDFAVAHPDRMKQPDTAPTP